MPYTEAVLREIMRYETLVPNGLAHKALVDTEFLGYNIPKVNPILGRAQSRQIITNELSLPEHGHCRRTQFSEPRCVCLGRTAQIQTRTILRRPWQLVAKERRVVAV